jgi:hypothetical protein
MSTEEHKIGCTGKREFGTFCQAKRAAKRMNRAHEAGHLEAYACRHCHRFHVGEARDYGRRKPKSETTA